MDEGVRCPDGDGEGRLIARAAAGDAQAFEALYRRYSGRVYALCLRLSGSAGRAEELTQATFVRVWEKLRTFRGESAFSTWLYRLVVNVALEGLRAERRWADRVVDLDVEGRAGAVEMPDIRLSLEEAIARLPDRARVVFVLFQVEGYAHEEIAGLTGMSAGASKAQLHRARYLLLEMMGDDVE